VAICNGNTLHIANIRQLENSMTDSIVDDGNVLRSNAYSLGRHITERFDCPMSLQSLCAVSSSHGTAIACVNSAGCTAMASLEQSEHEGINVFDIKSLSIARPTSSAGSGWAGICAIHDGVATAHYMSKQIVWTDQNTLQPIRTSISTGNPTCIASYLPPDNGQSSLGRIVVSGDMDGVVSVWDVRVSARGKRSPLHASALIPHLSFVGGCVHREVVCSNRDDRLWSVLPM
jgi:WD40 repeat protein